MEKEQMITLTDEAAEQLQSLCEERNLEGHGLRLFVEGGGCAGLQYGMYFDSARREGDTVLEAKGIAVYVDDFSVRYLEGASIDYRDSPSGGGFRVDNPNAVATCACGSSFRVE
jgi:iron-sulfur cluster assembly protein